MPQTFIPLKPATSAANRDAAAIAGIVAPLAAFNDMLARINNMVNAPDYTQLEAYFGLAAGQGLLVYNYLQGANSKFQDVNVTNCLANVR